MDVCDLNGDKIGSVGEVFSRASVGTGAVTGSGTSASGNYIKVDTGFLGLGKDLYIPAEYISDIVGDRVLLNTTKDAVDSMGWDHKPSGFDNRS
jgi:hypothetical protein